MQIKIEVDFQDCEFCQFAEEHGFPVWFSCPDVAAREVPNFCRVSCLSEGEKVDILIAPLEARKFIVRSQKVRNSRSYREISDSDIRYYAKPQDGMYSILELVFGGEYEVVYDPSCMSDWYRRLGTASKSGEDEKAPCEPKPMHEPESRHWPTLRDLILATDLSLGIVVYVKDRYFSWRFELPSECSDPEGLYRPSDVADKLLHRMGMIKDSKLFDISKVMDHAAKIGHGAGEGMVAFTVDV